MGSSLFLSTVLLLILLLLRPSHQFLLSTTTKTLDDTDEMINQNENAAGAGAGVGVERRQMVFVRERLHRQLEDGGAADGADGDTSDISEEEEGGGGVDGEDDESDGSKKGGKGHKGKKKKQNKKGDDETEETEMVLKNPPSASPTLQYQPVDDEPSYNHDDDLDINDDNDDDDDDDENKEEETLTEELEEDAQAAKKVGFWFILLTIAGMIFTAHQVSDNPDGVYASICRLSITISGFIIKIMLIPCKYIFGNQFPNGGHHHPISQAPDYREPYRGRHGHVELS